MPVRSLYDAVPVQQLTVRILHLILMDLDASKTDFLPKLITKQLKQVIMYFTSSIEIIIFNRSSVSEYILYFRQYWSIIDDLIIIFDHFLSQIRIMLKK